MTQSDEDIISRPEHYTYGSIECIDVIAEATQDLKGKEAFCIGNAIKYLWRWKHKNGLEDLRKAQWYISRVLASNEEND